LGTIGSENAKKKIRVLVPAQTRKISDFVIAEERLVKSELPKVSWGTDNKAWAQGKGDIIKH